MPLNAIIIINIIIIIMIIIMSSAEDRLAGLVVRASALGMKDPGFKMRL